MYKLVKLTRLLRIFKLIKEKNKLLTYFRNFLSLHQSFERLIFYLIGLLFFTHVIACVWVMVASLQKDLNTEKKTWIEEFGYTEIAKVELYLTSLYWAFTTITTVGYGDISGKTPSEMVYCIIIMYTGVLCFTFASGSITTFIQSYDSENAIYKQKLEVLNRTFHKYEIPVDLYVRLKNSLNEFKCDHDEINNFLDNLPHKLKV